jgi:nickel-dependent lactate racemase
MINLLYADKTLNVNIPQDRILFDVGPREVEPVEDLSRAVYEALASPIGTPPLRNLVGQARNAIIICDDYTRPTPIDEIVPLLMDELNASGVPDSDIKILVATGTHRKMTEVELSSKIGPKVLRRISVIQHDAFDTASLVSCGTTRSGIEIRVNRHVIESDVRIGVGSIFPHFPTGWGGGAKIVLPGVAGEQTTAQMHLLGAEKPHLGGREESPMRQAMNDFAHSISLDFIVNTVLNCDDQVAGVIAGHFVDAHKAGIDRAESIWQVPISQYVDLCITSTAPVDFDLGQAGKGILAASFCTKPGGEIVLVSPCYEGFSLTHPRIGHYMTMTDEQIWSMTKTGQAEDVVAAAVALNLGYAKNRCEITAVSDGLTPKMADQIGFKHITPAEFPEYIEERIKEEPTLYICILRKGAHLVPFIQNYPGA